MIEDGLRDSWQTALSKEDVRRLTSVGGSHRRSSPQDHHCRKTEQVDSANLKALSFLAVKRVAESIMPRQRKPQCANVDFTLSAQIRRRGSLGVCRALTTDETDLQNAIDSKQTCRPRLRNPRESAFCQFRTEERHRDGTTPEVRGA